MQTYAVAAGHPLTAKAAEDILQQGGNAYDAVIAAVLMSFVAEPLLSSPGGGGFLLAAGPEQAPKLLDFFSNTPLIDSRDLKPSDWDFYPISGDFGDKTQEFHIGRAAAAVPGVVAGIYKTHEKLATMPLTLLARPAIQAATKGIEINSQQAFVATILTPVINATKQASVLYQSLKQGAVWKNSQLADFLDTLSKSHHDWFYRQPLSDSMYGSKDCLLQSVDFHNYQCIVREPLQLQCGDYQVLTNPYPSTGGLLIAEQLKHHRQLTSDYPVFNAMVSMEKNKQKLLNTVSRGTTHISVADHLGNLASLTLSNGEGNGHIVPGCGFMMNNFLGESDINQEGFFNWSSGQRMRSMMAPTLIRHPENSYALGSGGSNRIKTAIFQVANRIINHNSLLKTAVEAPRMHFEDNHLDLEPGFAAAEISHYQNETKVIQWQNNNLYFGGVNAVQTGETLAAVGDFRRHGCGLVGLK
ncbi:gamma-glutamyltransferase [Marinicella gelatinilytica]|uniref:gamma-glutamyltransferase n=1 Tax=Marinicella gelatinilytica TaxID=2996017 RepID=UPI002260AF78|nr:gamma-glutamyltransferase [Marinicella gelatinilytica]MCX7545901.1 gamma-glutamyltransferase [Marinicella gelatinilytica]